MTNSVVRDQISEVREKLAAGEADLARQLAQLERVPGWLRVGDPERFAHPRDVRRAKRAETLRERIDELVESNLRLASELDDLDTGAITSFPSDSLYAVTLPMRLETRFTRPTPGARPGSVASKWKLRVRVEPDPLALPAQVSPATRREARLVARCWSEARGDLHGERGEQAFRLLASRVRPARAAFLLRTVEVDREGPGTTAFAPVGDFPETSTPLPPLVGLPGRLEIWGGPADGPRRLLTLRPDAEAIAAQAGLEAVKPRPDGRLPRTWWNSYEAARRVGLAGRIVLGPDEPFLEVLLCVGLARPDHPTTPKSQVTPLAIFREHAKAGRLGTLPPLSPTNTVNGMPAADLGRDPEPWLRVARLPRSTGAGLSMGLTGMPTFVGLPEPDRHRHDAATALVRALWPVLWQRSLKDLAGLGQPIYGLGNYAGRNLHPFGPLPALRVGDLPYGVLPTGDFGRMVDSRLLGSPVEEVILGTLNRLLPTLSGAAGTDLTAAGAGAERLLQVLSQLPTSRAYGSRHYPAAVILAALTAALGGTDPAATIAAWDAQAAVLRDLLPRDPLRRHAPLAHVEPWPERVSPQWPRLLERFLDQVSWGELAEVRDDLDHWFDEDGLAMHPLARLVRQSLLLTMVEAGRVRDPAVPTDVAYLLPLSDPQQMFSDALAADEGGPVRDVPGNLAGLVGPGDPRDSRRDAVVRQFEDVRTAVRELAAMAPDDVGAVLTGVLDAAGHRPDVWYTAVATRRLLQLHAIGAQAVLGAYGWVDDLRPSTDPTPPTGAGLLHAPSYPQALTSAVLRDHAVINPEDDRWRLTLESSTVRAAAELADQVRGGLHLSEVLGREIERRFPQPARVLTLRERFPARPEWAGRRVCDGQRILDEARDHPAQLPSWLDPKSLRDLRDALDAYADLLVADALHAVVEGRPEAASDALEAAAGLGAPPELRMLSTRREGATVRTDVLFTIPWREAWESAPITENTSPVAVADPALARWLVGEVGRATGIAWAAGDHRVTLAGLHLSVADTVMLPRKRLDALARQRLGPGQLGGNADSALARVDRLCSLLGAPPLDLDLDTPAGQLAQATLRNRLVRLRAMAGDLVADLASPPRAGPQRRRLVQRVLRWGLTEDLREARAELAARRRAAAAPAKRTPAEVLAHRIRALLPSHLPLPLVLPGEIPRAFAHRAVLDDWLPVMAAVRPAMADLEAAALLTHRRWPSATSDPRDDPWAPPPADRHGVSQDQQLTVLVGPGLGERATQSGNRRAGLVRLDSWGETVPAPRHTTWTAFGYDAPRARAPQAVLLVVPADGEVTLGLHQVREAVLWTRKLARVRSLAGATPAEVSVGLPLGVVEVTGITGATLVDGGGP